MIKPKQILLIVILTITTVVFMFCSGCKKEGPPQIAPTPNVMQPKGCNIDITKLKDILWIPNNNIYAELKFYSNGVQYQQRMTDGIWSLSNGCDSIKVVRQNTFYWKINYLSSDTLKLQTLTGEVIMHK